MNHSKVLVPIFLFLPFLASTQMVLAEGSVFDQISGMPINQSTVTIFDDMLKKELASISTDAEGAFKIRVPKAARYAIQADKSTYFISDTVLAQTENTLKTTFSMSRKPGYVFDITIFDKAIQHNPINTLRDCKVEIYNNTTHQQELTVERMPKSTFNFSFAEGNYYTVLVRKPGYFNHRIEIYVNVEGCILCVDGMGVEEPDVVQVMTHNNELGYLLGNIDLDSVQIGKRFQLDNVYYDFDKSNILPEAARTLDKLAVFLKDNPAIKTELGSHSDARGSDEYNLSLSERRAQSAVDYLVSVQGIDSDKIAAKGYGETQLVNRCVNGQACSEAEHQLNRRTEIQITGVTDTDPLWPRSLKEIIEDKELYRKIIEQEKRQKLISARR